MPALSCDELVEHPLVVGLSYQNVIHADMFMVRQSPTDAIYSTFSLLHSSRVPLDVEMYKMGAEGLQVDSFGADVAGDEKPTVLAGYKTPHPKPRDSVDHRVQCRLTQGSAPQHLKIALQTIQFVTVKAYLPLLLSFRREDRL